MPDLDLNQKKQFVDEAMRRKAGLGASTVAMDAEASNTPFPGNPIPPSLMTNPPTPPAPSGGAAGFPSDGAGQQLKQEKSEEVKITDHLMRRQKALEKRAEMGVPA